MKIAWQESVDQHMRVMALEPVTEKERETYAEIQGLLRELHDAQNNSASIATQNRLVSRREKLERFYLLLKAKELAAPALEKAIEVEEALVEIFDEKRAVFKELERELQKGSTFLIAGGRYRGLQSELDQLRHKIASAAATRWRAALRARITDLAQAREPMDSNKAWLLRCSSHSAMFLDSDGRTMTTALDSIENMSDDKGFDIVTRTGGHVALVEEEDYSRVLMEWVFSQERAGPHRRIIRGVNTLESISP